MRGGGLRARPGRCDRLFSPAPRKHARLDDTLAHRRLKILAQLHTHPGRAYHSEVDDEWAIVRHVGALSLVLPYFAASTTVDNFLEQAMTYELSAANEWLHVPNRGRAAPIEVRA
jgi:hypothetical protein